MVDPTALSKYILAAFLIEAIVNLFMSIYKPVDGKQWWECLDYKILLAILMGELVSFGFGLDLMTVLGIPGAYWWFGILLTGLLVSRGSNFLHDLTSFIKSMKAQAEVNSALKKQNLLAKPSEEMVVQRSMPQ